MFISDAWYVIRDATDLHHGSWDWRAGAVHVLVELHKGYGLSSLPTPNFSTFVLHPSAPTAYRDLLVESGSSHNQHSARLRHSPRAALWQSAKEMSSLSPIVSPSLSGNVTSALAITTRPTAAIAQPLTTPFVFPPGCGGHFSSTYTVTQHRVNASPAIFRVVASIPSQNPTCQPRGWNAGSTPFVFSPAVCPSEWTAYELKVYTSTWEEEIFTLNSTYTRYLSTVVSQACCCSKYVISIGMIFPTSRSSQRFPSRFRLLTS